MRMGLFTDELFILEKEPVGAIVELTGEFVRYFYENASSNFVIAQFITNNYEEFVVAGNVPFILMPNRSYTISGEITEREDKFTGVMERQLKLQKIITLLPEGEVQVIKFLGSITGITVASLIYDKYEADTLKIVKTDPERVSGDFRGVSLKAAKELQAEVLDALGEVSEAFPFLQGYGFSVDEVEAMIKVYGEEIKHMVLKNPYILMSTDNGFPGANFNKCDKIARENKFDLRDIRRIKAGVEYAFILQGNAGHTYFFMPDVIKQSLTLLNSQKGVAIKRDRLETAIEELIMTNVLHFDGRNQRVYLKRYYEYERALALNLVSLLDDTEWVPRAEREALLDDYLTSEAVLLETKQRRAVLDFSKSASGVGVINGGAGTGKTFTLNIFLELMKRLYKKEKGRNPFIQLMAPTGKAAKVMTEATGMQATTIHRALGWTTEGFIFNTANPLSADIVVIDEASMLDTYMAYSLSRAVKLGTKIVFLGDPNQLPSIGAGNVLHDIVSTGAFDTVTLDVPKRQKANSQVSINGLRIAAQLAPLKDEDDINPKAITKTKATPEALLDQATLALEYLLHQGVAMDDIQIITPGRKGITGVYNMNYKLQQLLNPHSSSIEVLNQHILLNGKKVALNFRVGDRVIHTTNTDKLEWVRESKTDPSGYKPVSTSGPNTVVTNGEIGRIASIFEETYITQSGRKQKRTALIVQYDDGLVKYTSDDKRNLDHAFAMTIHKSQGSQWKAVIQLISAEHYMLLDNSLLYTGYTRSRDYQVLLADPRALDVALHTRRTFERRTSLDECILKEVR